VNLFKKGEIKLHSGKVSNFKIECDALSSDDLDTLAYLVSKRIKFMMVDGVPRGGLKFAEALGKYKSKAGPVLIVDDVLTTGNSMNEERQRAANLLGLNSKEDFKGVVIFARGKCPKWVTPIFQMWEE